MHDMLIALVNPSLLTDPLSNRMARPNLLVILVIAEYIKAAILIGSDIRLDWSASSSSTKMIAPDVMSASERYPYKASQTCLMSGRRSHVADVSLSLSKTILAGRHHRERFG